MAQINFMGAFPQCRQTVVDEPSTAAEIVALIRMAHVSATSTS